MRGEKCKYLLLFYVILSVIIENICKQIIPSAKFAIRLAIANLRKLLDMYMYVHANSYLANYKLIF